jgi:hypothetical protein
MFHDLVLIGNLLWCHYLSSVLYKYDILFPVSVPYELLVLGHHDLIVNDGSKEINFLNTCEVLRESFVVIVRLLHDQKRGSYQ